MTARRTRICAAVIIALLPLWSQAADEYSVTFLTAAAARTAIIDDSLDPYFSQLQPMEMSAKTGSPITGTGLEAQRAECRRRYQAGVREFNQQEKAALKWHLSKLYPALLEQYPLFAATPWRFLKVADNIEGGLPHTRGKHIVLSEQTCSRTVYVAQLPAERLAYLSRLELLVHEQMHVFQRTHPGAFDKLYTDVWGYRKVGPIAGCRWLVQHHLANPDATECNWILTGKDGEKSVNLWPLAVFSEGDGLKTMPADFRLLAIALERTETGLAVKTDSRGMPVSTDLLTVPLVKKLFPLSDDGYHPYEAGADMFGKIVVYDLFLKNSRLVGAAASEMEAAFAPAREWYRKHLRTAAR